MKRSVALLSLLLVTMTGCGSSSNGVVSGGGQIVEFTTAGERGTPINLSGTSLDGKPINVASYRGKVLVINLWWSGCQPCIAEAPKLKAAYASGKAAFIGINILDSSAAQGLAFERALGIPYPSIYAPDGSAVLAFNGSVSPKVVPATIVLDPQGRVAAVVRGLIQGNDTLKDLIQDASKAVS
jgi:thiol-disulfide isomerase/thioredoxin